MPTADYDPLLQTLADYTLAPLDAGETARATARLCLLDALGCALLALDTPACARHLGPVAPGTTVTAGARVPGTSLVLDPVRAAFCLGTMIRWLDFNDTWLAAEWGHPSDNLAAIMAVADASERPLPMRTLIDALIKAYEIQGVLALNHSLNERGLDHVFLVRLASAAVATWLLGGDRMAVLSALSHAFLDGAPLRAYRHAPDTGPRKSWAAGDAASRGVWLALLALRGEPGCPHVLSTPTWGFQDALFGGQPLALARPLGTYVVENILFKIAHPAEFHAQTAVEAAVILHPEVRERLDDVAAIEVATQRPALRIIDKPRQPANPADRDHCLRYMVAVALLKGDLQANDYEDAAAADPRIERLRSLVRLVEDPAFTAAYHDPARRAIPNAVRIVFHDGSTTRRVAIADPLGHPHRRAEGESRLREKARRNLLTRLAPDVVDRLLLTGPTMESGSVREFMDLLTTNLTRDFRVFQ